jgi:Flp pilus assembly pilin Flp
VFLVQRDVEPRRYVDHGAPMRKLLRLHQLSPGRRRRAVLRLARRAFGDDHGGEAMEYALIAGLIVVASIATISCVGAKVLARWNSVNDGL